MMAYSKNWAHVTVGPLGSMIDMMQFIPRDDRSLSGVSRCSIRRYPRSRTGGRHFCEHKFRSFACCFTVCFWIYQTEEMKTAFAAILLVCLWQQAVGGLRWKIFRPCSFLPPFPSARILLFFGPFSVICAGDYCPRDYYDCGNGYCVPDDTVCDGTENCMNGADEDNCGE